MVFSNRSLYTLGLLATLTIVNMSGVASSGAGPSDHIVMFGPMQTDRKVELEKGDTLIVKLLCRPGTGYQWKVSKIDESHLKLEGDPVLECGEDKDKDTIGGVENQVFRFRVKKSGKRTIEFEYKQPFDKESPPEKTSKLEVMVK